MKKLTAGIFTVLLGLVAANSADAAVASKGYVDEMVGVNTTAIEALGGTVAGHTQSIADLDAADGAINAKIGTVADGKTVVEMIADAKQEAIDGVASYDDTVVRGLIGDNANAISELETKVGNSSVAAQIDAVRATTIAGLTPEQQQTMFPTVDLTGQMIATSTIDLGGLANANAAAITTINEGAVMNSGITADKVAVYEGYGAKITANETAAAGAQAAAEAAQGAADAAQDAADANATAIAAINNSENGLLKQAETAAKSYADSLADNYDAAGSATAAEAAAKAYADGLGSNYDAAGAADAAETAAKAYADSLATNYDAAGAAATAEAAAKEYTDAQVKNVDDKLADYALKSTIGEVESGKTVVQMISDAETAATYDDTEVRGLIATNKTATETNATAIATNKTATETNAAAIAANTAAAEAAQGAADAAQGAADAAQGAANAAQQTANNAIPKPSGECADPDNKCVLTFNNTQYAWEVIERNGAGE